MTRIVHVSNDRYFGGVPEVIRGEIKAFARRGVDHAWLTLRLGDRVRVLGKFLNDCLHGVPPRVALAAGEVAAELAAFGRAEAERLRREFAAGDVVMLHDPLALALAPALRASVRRVLWRSHIGADAFDEHVATAAGILGAFVDAADGIVFHRAAYMWPSLHGDARVLVSPPGIDPESPKNMEIGAEVRDRLLPRLLTSGRAGAGPVLDDHGTGRLPDAEVPYLLQVARWDRHKGHEGLLRGPFLDALATGLDTHHLVLVGPRCVPGFSDPDNLALLRRLRELRDAAPRKVRDRIHLWSFTVGDPPTEGRCVNLLQRGAHTVLQKSTREGFGLSVTEAMWKRKVVVASAAGGLREQISRGVNGVLSPDLDGGAAWSSDVLWACRDTGARPRWAKAAHASAHDFLSSASVERLAHLVDQGAE